ncbi:DUF547 domain-containing protein [Flaviaesturariibacter amylovorans]|uniref:Thioredoxin domain-containing protein n=1 Tax=Flaviaesturariibacter amylovorans TaxID=1084520 RepID=A0ABP8HQ24_9BACT
MLRPLVFALLLLCGPAAAQGFRPGDVVPDLPTPRVLNHSGRAATLAELRGRITILDLFGTWCVPCVRALPHLRSLQAQFPELKVLLLSSEPEAKLRAFLQGRDLPFPVIVDAGGSLTARFAPPAYPYTLVLDARGAVLAATDAAALTPEAIRGWLAAQPGTAVSSGSPAPMPAAGNHTTPSSALVRLSQEFAYAVKTGDPAAPFLDRLRALDLPTLRDSLRTNAEKTAFWINVYNAYTQVLLHGDPSLYQSRGRFFSARRLELGGERLSLDDIEHGLLRRSRIKWSHGYLRNPFPGAFKKALRVDTVDPRVHFALNCGAKSCPPIAFYSDTGLDRQLELAANNYLSTSVSYDAAQNVATLPAILGWFRGDFGGKDGLRRLLHEKGLVPPNKKPRLRFGRYDWQLFLDNYKTDPI